MENELWIARDEDGTLYLYWVKPQRDKLGDEYGTFFVETRNGVNHNNDMWRLNDKFYPELTWENSPQRLIPEHLEDLYHEEEG